jgi:hypothetical protein
MILPTGALPSGLAGTGENAPALKRDSLARTTLR